jgi:hypothetical protein
LALMGWQEGENLFADAASKRQTTYVQAIIRRCRVPCHARPSAIGPWPRVMAELLVVQRQCAAATDRLRRACGRGRLNQPRSAAGSTG